MTAAIITAISSTMPTAVMIESSENTMSMIMICTITAAKPALTADAAWPSTPSSDWWISPVLFQRRNRPPPIRTRSRPEISWPTMSMRNSGAVMPMIQESMNSRPTRMNIARNRPIMPRLALLLRRQLVDQDRDEDDVVDAEHQLERGERQEARSRPAGRSGVRASVAGAATTRRSRAGGAWHSRRAQAKRENTWSSRTVIAVRAAASTKLASKLLRASA